MTIASSSDPIAELWREARAWLSDAMHDLRGPAQVAHVIARKIRAAIKARIARLELLLMKLLLIEAVHHPSWTAGLSLGRSSSFASAKPGQAPIAAPAGRCAPGRARSNLARAEDSHDPESWRVRFHLRMPRERAPHQPPRDAGGPRIRDIGPPLLVRDIWRERERRALVDRLRRFNPANAPAKALALARRFEAIRRVIADPRRAIAALARKLLSLGKRARASARRIACAAPRRCRIPALGNAVGYALYACYDLPGDDTS